MESGEIGKAGRTRPTSSSSLGGHDVDSKAEEELVGMSNERRQAVEALTEERVGLRIYCFPFLSVTFSPVQATGSEPSS